MTGDSVHRAGAPHGARWLGEQAVVIGASIAGLLAARVLSESYERVRSSIATRCRAGIAELRRAVPQDRQIHGMQPAGQLALERLFPGFCVEARAAGAPPLAFGRQMRFRLGGHLLARVDLPGEYCLTSRGLLESLVRRRVRALANVTLHERCNVLGLVTDGSRVAGVRACDRAPDAQERTLRAELAVTASGRGAKLPAWLEALGYPRPAEERVAVDVLYASRYLRVRVCALGGDRVVLDDARPGRPRGLSAQTVEGDRWIVTLSGYGPEHHPPADGAGWTAFLATVSDPEVFAAFAHADPLGDIEMHAFPAAVRRRYDRLRRLPRRLLVIGDAWCNLNPIYGQGMSVAALEAVALQRTLRAGDLDREALLQAARPAVEHASKLATDADRALPELGLRMSPLERMTNRYIDCLLAAAERDEALARILYDVTGMLVAPTRLLAPSTVPRVLRGACGR